MDFTDAFHDLFGRTGEDINAFQMSARAVLVFLFGVALVRLGGARAFGKWTALDIVVSIIICLSLSRTLTGNTPLIPTLVSTAVLVALHAVLAQASLRFHPLSLLTKGRPCPLVEDGRVDERALKRHGVGRHDLEEALRKGGVEDPSQVRLAMLERNGDISVLKR